MTSCIWNPLMPLKTRLKILLLGRKRMIMNQKRTVPAAIHKSLQTRAWLPVDVLVSDVWAITFVQFSTQTLPPLSGVYGSHMVASYRP